MYKCQVCIREKGHSFNELISLTNSYICNDLLLSFKLPRLPKYSNNFFNTSTHIIGLQEYRQTQIIINSIVDRMENSELIVRKEYIKIFSCAW